MVVGFVTRAGEEFGRVLVWHITISWNMKWDELSNILSDEYKLRFATWKMAMFDWLF